MYKFFIAKNKSRPKCKLVNYNASVEHENASTTNDNDSVQEYLSLLKTTQDAYDKIADKPGD